MTKAILPLLDIVFLTLGSVLACMTQMERVTALPVSVAKVGSGAASVQQGEFDILTLSVEGMALNGRPTSEEQLSGELEGRRVILRAEQSLPTERTLTVLAALVRAGAEVSVEVKESKVSQKDKTGRQ